MANLAWICARASLIGVLIFLAAPASDGNAKDRVAPKSQVEMKQSFSPVVKQAAPAVCCAAV